MTDVSDPLVVRRTYDASRERVYHAWTDREQMERWYTPDISNPVVFESFDLRIGGGYRVAFGAPAGETPYVETATYVELDPPARIVMTTRLTRGDALLAETHNTFDFRDLGARTEVVMTETGGPIEVREDRREGWGRTMDNLHGALGAS